MSLLDALLLDPLPTDVWIAYRTDGVKGSGTQSDPSDGSTAAKFDAVMTALPADTTIHLGPGVFETTGYSETAGGGWTPKSGQKIIGSGMKVTTLKLVNASLAGQNPYFAIGGTFETYLTSFEASDFTVDCNLAGQPPTLGASYAKVACGAIKAFGRHVRLRRIRAINWGSQAMGKECFVLFSGGAHPLIPETYDCVIEDCVVEQPSMSTADGHTLISMGAYNSLGMQNRSCVIRHCVGDAEVRQNDVPIEKITFSGTTATVHTRCAHGRQNNEWVTVSGAYVNGNPDNLFNGSFKISNADTLRFQCTLASTPTTAAEPAGQVYLDRAPVHAIGISTGTRVSTVATVTTKSAHYRKPGDVVRVQDVLVPDPPNPPTKDNPFNGAFVISDVLNPTQLKYEMASPPNYDANNNTGGLGVYYSGAAIGTARGGATEGNRLVGVGFGHYSDSGSSREMIVRDNYWSEVALGVYHFKGGTEEPPNGNSQLGSVTHVGNIATFQIDTSGSYFPHGLNKDDAVDISGVEQNEYNGTFSIVDVPTATSFKYEMQSDPGQNGTGAPRYKEMYQVGLMDIENNIVELTPLSSGDYPYGIIFYGRDRTTPYVFKRLIVRDNIVSVLLGGTDTGYAAGSIATYSCEQGLVENNVVDLPGSPLPAHSASGSIVYQYNQTPAGQLLQGVGATAQDELATRIADALAVCLL